MPEKVMPGPVEVFHVEFLCDYTGYWCRTGHVDLRDGKYKKLRTQQALALGEGAYTSIYNHQGNNQLCTIVAMNKEAEAAAHGVAMQIAAMNDFHRSICDLFRKFLLVYFVSLALFLFRP